MIVLSLGAGIQSTAVLLMSEIGDLPPLDAAVFADTGWEPPAVLEHLAKLQKTCKTPIIVGQAGDIRATSLAQPFNSMPVYQLVDGEIRMGQRQCTYNYKIKPVKHMLRNLLGVGRKDRIAPGSVELWLGISTDELSRAKMSNVQWIDHHFPLILDKKYTRADCIKYLEQQWPDPVPRSACIGCPFKSNQEWLELKQSHPEQWADAVAFDRAIPDYLHRTATPLDQVDLNENQPDLFGMECGGMCAT